MIQENKTVLPIEVSMEMDDTSKEIVITVKDRGIGIDMSINEKLFSKFVTTSDGGTGLGLYVSKSLVEAHGGRIWAYNNDNEHGATFCFTLPLNP
jgi:signal transduction histidine kinase